MPPLVSAPISRSVRPFPERRPLRHLGTAASTIARCLKGYAEASLSEPTVLVHDEANMVDIFSKSQDCEILPLHVRLLLLSGSNQRMPVGRGLVLHTVAAVPQSQKQDLLLGDEMAAPEAVERLSRAQMDMSA